LTCCQGSFNIVEIFNNPEIIMSTMNFSVPEDVKQVFNETFEGQNKSAIIAELMLEAVERARQKRRSQAAYLSIIERRQRAPIVSEAEVRAAREQGRS